MPASEKITIRPYQDADASPVGKLFSEVNRLLAPPAMVHAFEQYIERSMIEEIGRIPDYYAERGGSFWVATTGNEIVGMFGLERLGEVGMELRRMYVNPGWRRRGIARQLLDFAEAHCRNTGVAEMHLSTSELQPAALILYQNAGYQPVRQEIVQEASNKTIGGGVQRYHFVKNL